jgi:hypothetical protein
VFPKIATLALACKLSRAADIKVRRKATHKRKVISTGLMCIEESNNDTKPPRRAMSFIRPSAWFCQLREVDCWSWCTVSLSRSALLALLTYLHTKEQDNAKYGSFTTPRFLLGNLLRHLPDRHTPMVVHSRPLFHYSKAFSLRG